MKLGLSRLPAVIDLSILPCNGVDRGTGREGGIFIAYVFSFSVGACRWE